MGKSTVSHVFAVNSARCSTIPAILKVVKPVQEPQALGVAVTRRLVEKHCRALLVGLGDQLGKQRYVAELLLCEVCVPTFQFLDAQLFHAAEMFAQNAT